MHLLVFCVHLWARRVHPLNARPFFLLRWPCACPALLWALPYPALPYGRARVAVLKAWASIAERGALPRVRVLIAARLGRDRLRDQSSMVRKEAVRVS